MEIRIRRIDSVELTGNLPGTANTYRVIEDGREFLLTRTVHRLSASIAIRGKPGILYVDVDDNRVHHQSAVPSGACGLYTDDAVVEGLSPLALRAVVMADQVSEPGEIRIIRDDADGGV